ncbi:MAG TPA: 4-hydroxy-tetrahydrodipicolinate reductase [Candidatus Omnitrophica bacterium]|nr:MAG: 4-hydroxy-tetrahydrodipicolinate reductase [Omnitrophica WOR_2 bacterium GWA2_45_18]OGX20647.1 MAG: 4-hydroxy-tetrahydrodipicolinate reductase [Omnitrophica WOR_2 bacterium GWC2_45_7]HBR15453.1 4-hydroxy-tetrahydrodipicolinate reductase [Candidatus Omnitrophota bacterium]
MINLAVSGCLGRMGQSITRLALQDHEFKLHALLERKDHPKTDEWINGVAISTDGSSLNGCDVLIEFTTPQATIDNLQVCLKHNVKMVIGTTGLEHDQIMRIQKASEKIPIVFSSNMSVGVNLLFKLTQIASEKTGTNYTINITEAHHIHKKDAPSGTAKTLAEVAEKASGQKVRNIESIRENEIIGDHTITFESNDDMISIFHHAKSRDIFAKGALVAAKFVSKKDKGLFNMQDVLGLR